MDKEQSIPDEINNKIAERAKSVFEETYASYIKVEAFIQGAEFGYFLTPCCQWIVSNEIRPTKNGFYYCEDSIGGKTMTHFYDNHWHSLTGHPVVKWLDETHPCQCTKYKEALEKAKEALEQCISRINPKSKDTWDLKALLVAKEALTQLNK